MSSKGTYIMRKPHTVNRQFLARCYDLSQFEGEELHWDYYDALHASEPTKLAISHGENSIATFRLDKYVKLSQPLPEKALTQEYPEPFDKLLLAQAKNGKWERPDIVKKILGIPNHFTLEKCVPWEEATALALAAIRIRCDLFDLLIDAHNKAIGLISDKSLLYRAAHIVGAIGYDIRDEALKNFDADVRRRLEEEEYDRHAIIPRYTNPNKVEGHNFDSAIALQDGGEEFDDEFAESSQATSITKVSCCEDEYYDFSEHKGRNSTLSNPNYVPLIPIKAKPKELEQSAPNPAFGTGTHTGMNVSFAPTPIEPMSPLASTPLIKSPITSPKTVRSSAVTSPLPTSRLSMLLSKEVSRADISRIDQVVKTMEALKMQIIKQATLVDKKVEEIKICLHECATAYSLAETHAVRNVTFERLTAMIGDGARPRIGLMDWRQDGVEGVRPLIMKCLHSVYLLAQTRLIHEELKELGRCTGSYDQVNLVNYVVSLETVASSGTQRWSFIWDSDEIVHKLLHCLDFLRSSAELSEWYGRSFFFTGNPLMLPFPMELDIIQRFKMLPRIQHELTSKPYCRTAVMDYAADWQYQAYLVTWNNSFVDICKEKYAFNWPTIPDTKEDADRNSVYLSMLMLFTKCFNDCLSTVEHEKKFISLNGTARGKHLVQWTSENPPPVRKQFIIPTNRKTVPVEDFVKTKLLKQYNKLLEEHTGGNMVTISETSSLKEQQAKNMSDFYAEMKAMADSKPPTGINTTSSIPAIPVKTAAATPKSALKPTPELVKSKSAIVATPDLIKSKPITAVTPTVVTPVKLSNTERFNMMQKTSSASELVDARKSRSSKLIIGTSHDIKLNKVAIANATDISKAAVGLLLQQQVDVKALKMNDISQLQTGVVAPKPTLTTAEMLLDNSRSAEGGGMKRKGSVRTTPSRLRADTLHVKAAMNAKTPDASSLPPIREASSAPLIPNLDKMKAKFHSKLSMIVSSHNATHEDPTNNLATTVGRKSVVSRIEVNPTEKLTRRVTNVTK